MKKNLRIVVILMIAIIMLIVTSCVSRKRANQAPSAVVNIYPSQSELVDENYFYSKWTASTDPEGGAVTYRINYARTIEGLDDPTFYETVETYFLLPNLEEGIWYWRVTAMDKNGNSTKSPIWTFTINGESLPQPVDPEEIPTDPSLIVSEVENTSFTLDWPAYEDRQNPGRAVEYVIYVYDQGQGMSTRNVEEMGYWMARIAPATTAHTTDTSHTFNNMNSQTLYDWVIVAQNSASQTSVVGSSQVRTGNRAPSQPELLNPTEGATDVATDVTLSWSASVDPDGDAVKYYVYIDMVKNTNRNVTVEGIDETEYQPEGLEEGRTYYWFIMAKDANGAATRTQTNTFMTKAEGMDVPNNPTPGDGTEGMDATAPPLLEWEHDKNGAPITYTVYMSANPKKIDKKAEGLTAKNYQIQGLLEGNTRYYWAIEAKDTGTDKTTRSGVWTFKTGTIEAPEQTGAITNSDGTQIELTYDKAMGDPSGKKDAYTVKKEQTANITSRDSRTITTYQTIETSKIERKAGTTNAYVLTLEEAIESGDKVFIDYTPGTIASTDGGKLAQYKNVAVTNRVPGEAPLVTEATASTNTIEIAFDKDMKDVPSGAKTQFSVQSGSVLKQIESVTRTASDTYTLTLKDGQSIAYGETVLISYAKGSVQAQNEAYLESFAGIAANNTVPAPQPQFVSGETSEDGLTVKVTFDRAMADPTGKHGQFHLGINETQTIGRSAPTTTIESATLNSADAKIIELGLNRAVSNGDVLTLDYTAGDVESADGAALATFTDKPISNRVPAPLPICTAATMTADGRHVEIGFSRDMKAPTAEEANQFGVLVNGYVDEIESATLSADKRVITLNLQKPIGKNNEVHLSYTKGTVAATNDGLLESFQNKKVNTDALDTIWVIKGIGWNYSTIQDAIDAQETENGDIIMVATGTYRENVNFNGKALMLTSTWQTDPLASSTTIIDGGNNGTAAVTIGTEEHYVSMDRGTELAKDFNNWTKSRSDMPSYAIIAGFTIQNGAGQSYDSTSRENINSGVPCGINVVGLAQIAYNIITDNGNESTALNGYGIYVSEAARVLIGMNVIQNNYNSWNGAGIYLENYNDFSSGRDMGATALIAMNEIRDNKARKGAGIYIEDGVNVEGLNIEGYGEYWKHFNAPNAEVLFVEQAATQTVNSYSNNTLIEERYSVQRMAVQEGANIYWEVEEDTLTGSLSLRPETAYEQTEVTLNLDYTIGCEYHNGSVVFTIGENSGHNFEITAGASVVIGEEATAITTYSYSTTVATVTGIKLESGTVTLRLTPQETPAGTVVNTISTRDLDYEMSAVGDADGSDSVWSETTASTATFVAKELSIVTDIAYKAGNEPYVKLLETPKRLKVASETTVDTVLAAIKATDDSSQTYAIITASGTQTGEDELTGEATLIVTAEHGNKAEYAITINPTAFVRLETSASDSEGRLISRTIPQEAATTWHDTISDAVTDANQFSQSTITVWPGHYVENLTLGNKHIHLTSTDPASETVRANTIIDGNANGTAVKIGESVASSARGFNEGETIVEGFTVKNGESVLMLFGTGARPVINFSDAISAGIYINRVDAIVRNNLLTENGTGTGNPSADKSGIGIAVEAASPTLYNNTITNNYNILGGAGIGVIDGNPTIYNNTISDNVSYGYGAGIGIVDGMYLMESMAPSAIRENRSEPAILRPVIYNNTITNNAAVTGPGIFFYYRADPKNADGSSWKHFNSGTANVTFVENTTNSNNTYTGNTNLGNYTDGADIRYGTDTTAEGTLTLRPEAGTEREAIILNIDYLIGQEFHGGSLTVDIPTGFELTADASVIIDGTATEASNYTYSTQGITITGINLEAGTVTLRLANQAIPTGLANVSESRDLGYTFNARGDADGADTAWDKSDENETEFTSENLSLNTDFILTGTNPESIQYKTTSPATELKVASETTVQTVLDNIEAADDSEQSYSIYNDTTSKESPLATDTELTGAATLVVVSEHGEPYSAEFGIAINVTKFVRLEQENVASGGRLTGRTGAALSTTWHDTIAQAVDNAIGFRQSTITVWEGYYRETVDFTSKPIHLMSTDPASETVRTNTVIDGDGQGNTIMIGEMPEAVSSSRQVAGETIVEGFTITGGRMPAGGLSSVRSIDAYTLDYIGAIHLYGVDATIRNNLITENGTLTFSGPSSGPTMTMGWGIISENASPVIYDNEISKNFSYEGAAILIVGGGPEIYDNIIQENIAVGGPAICLISREQEDSVSARDGIYTETNARIYKNTLKENIAIAEEDGTNGSAAIFSNIMCNIYNRTGEAWKKFKSPAATIEFIEGGVAENRNIYIDNTVRNIDGSTEGIIEEGKEITFCGTESDMTQRTTKGTVETTPATALLGEPFTFVATYTFDGASWEATLTFEMPSQIDLSTDASITIGEAPRRALKAEEFDAGNGEVYLSGITGENERVVLEVNQHSEVPAGTHLIKAIADADGTGTLYIPSRQFVDSDTASSTLEIEVDGIFTLEKVDSSEICVTFDEAFGKINYGETATITTSESTEVIVSGQLQIDYGKDIRIKPADGETLTFKGDGGNRIFYVDGSTNGASLTLYNAVVRDGVYYDLGAGFYVNNAHLQLENCQIVDNQTTDYWGAGLVVQNSTALIQNTLIASNTADVNSGGMFVKSSPHVTIKNSTVCYNEAGVGGGILVNDSTVYIIDTVIASNTATGTDQYGGGGIYLLDGTITLEDCWIENNYSKFNGGGIYMTPGSGLPTLNFNSGHIRSNTADGDGGGIYRNAGNVYIDSIFWSFAGGNYDTNFSVNKEGPIGFEDAVMHLNDTSYPAKVYDNEAGGNGNQMKW